MSLDSLDRWLFGIVRAPLSCLTFSRSSGARLASRQNVEQKIRLFKEPLCAPHIYDNQVVIAINDTTRKKILSVLQVSPDQLRNPHLVFSLNANFKFLCQDGRSRIEAARRLYGANFEWTLRLYYVPSQPDQQIEFDQLFTRKCGSYNFQVPFSDGEIYRNIRTCPIDNRDWVSRLSKCKRPILRALLRHDQLTKALDSLLCFPGLWRGLQLGNIHKHIALHWDEELENYLKYVFDTWDAITNGEAALRQAVDVDTVRFLQYRIPSGIDASEIRALFHSEEVFPDVIDSNARKALEDRILGLQYFIPSLETFHRDTMHFSVAVKAVKRWIAPDFEASTPRLTLRSILASYFRPNTMWQEQAGGQWSVANGITTDDQENSFTFAYRQLILAALRRFAELSHESPTQEQHGKRVQGCINESCISHLRMTARTLGFLTPKVVGDGVSHATYEGEMNSFSHYPPQPCTSVPDVAAYTRTWKGGRPPTSIYLYLQSQLFDGNIVEAGPPSHQQPPSVIYIQKCIILAFFGGYASYHTAEVTMGDPGDDQFETKSRGSHLMDDSDCDGPYGAEDPKEETRIKSWRSLEVGGQKGSDGHRSALLVQDADMTGVREDGTQYPKEETKLMAGRNAEIGSQIDFDGHRSALLVEENIVMADEGPQDWNDGQYPPKNNQTFLHLDGRFESEEQDFDRPRSAFTSQLGYHQADTVANVPIRRSPEAFDKRSKQDGIIQPKPPSEHGEKEIKTELDPWSVAGYKVERKPSSRMEDAKRDASIKHERKEFKTKRRPKLENDGVRVFHRQRTLFDPTIHEKEKNDTKRASTERRAIAPLKKASVGSTRSLQLLDGTLDPRRSALVAWGETVDEQRGLADQGPIAQQVQQQQSPTSQLGEQSTAIVLKSQPIGRNETAPRFPQHQPPRELPKRQFVGREGEDVHYFEVGQPDSKLNDSESDKAERASTQARRKRRGFVFEHSKQGGKRILVQKHVNAHDPDTSDAETVHSASLRSPELSMPQPNEQATSEASEISDDAVGTEVSYATSSVYSETSEASDASVQTVRPQQPRRTLQFVSHERADPVANFHGEENAHLSSQQIQASKASGISLQAPQAKATVNKLHWIQNGLRMSGASDSSLYGRGGTENANEEEEEEDIIT